MFDIWKFQIWKLQLFYQSKKIPFHPRSSLQNPIICLPSSPRFSINLRHSLDLIYVPAWIVDLTDACLRMRLNCPAYTDDNSTGVGIPISARFCLSVKNLFLVRYSELPDSTGCSDMRLLKCCLWNSGKKKRIRLCYAWRLVYAFS